MSFADDIREVVRNIPRGETLTYGEVALLAGHPGAARAVGNVMMNNFDPSVPCHRVVAANGVGGYNGGIELKISLLKEEGAI